MKTEQLKKILEDAPDKTVTHYGGDGYFAHHGMWFRSDRSWKGAEYPPKDIRSLADIAEIVAKDEENKALREEVERLTERNKYLAKTFSEFREKTERLIAVLKKEQEK